MKTVQVYFNLHKKCFSVRCGGKVIKHCDKIILRDVTFKVSESGRQRVLREKRKNVHAFVVGDIFAGNLKLESDRYFILPVVYNPYKYKNFVEKNSKKKIISADYVSLVAKDGVASIMAVMNRGLRVSENWADSSIS